MTRQTATNLTGLLNVTDSSFLVNVEVLPPLTEHFRQALYKMETRGDSKQSSSRYIWSGRLSGLDILFWDQSLIYKSNNNVTHCRFTQL